MARAELEDLARVEVLSIDELRSWLEAHHRRTESVWLVTWKKRPGVPYVAYADVVDELLCFGWVDSLPRTVDEARTRILISPRRPGSHWSKVNKDKVARLQKAGRMRPAGRAAVDAARADGSWAALDAVETLALPEDLAAALAARPGARVRFDAFPRSSRRGILEWIQNAKRSETRARRVAETADKAARNSANCHKDDATYGDGYRLLVKGLKRGPVNIMRGFEPVTKSCEQPAVEAELQICLRLH